LRYGRRSLTAAKLWQKLVGRTPRERERRKALAASTVSWTVIAAIAGFVLLLIGQFISRTWINPPVSSEIERTDLLVKKGERIQLTILNGSGQPDLARQFTDYLRDRKFDVVEMSNYSSSNVEHSFIIDRVNDSSAAHKVAYALGVDPKLIRLQPDSDAFVDDAVVIGKDFRALKPMQEAH